MTTLGDRLKMLRGDLNQEDFSRAIAINRNSLRAYETGRSLPNAKVLAEICSKFDANPQWLLLGTGPMRRGEPQDAQAPEHGGTTAELEAKVAALETENAMLKDVRAAQQEALTAYKETLRITRASLEEKERLGPTAAGISAPSAPLIDRAND